MVENVIQHLKLSIHVSLSSQQNQLLGGAGARIIGAGARIKQALSPQHYSETSVSPSTSPYSSPKIPRFTLEPEMSSDEEI